MELLEDKTEIIRLSTFSHFIQLEDDLNVLWNALWLRAIFISGSAIKLIPYLKKGIVKEEIQTLDFFDSSANDLISELKKQNFLESKLDDEKIQQVHTYALNSPISLMYLVISEKCNLNCSYCYISDALNKNSSIMHEDVARKAIDFFTELILEQQVQHPKIIFYGGEPLLNFDLLKFALEYATTKIPKYAFVLNTNGTLVTEEIAKKLAPYNISVGLSIDGPPDLHNKNRTYHSEKPSFQQTESAYHFLKNAGVQVSISCTITDTNVHFLPKISEWFTKEFKPNAVDFNSFIGNYLGDKYTEAVSDGIIESFKILREHGIHVEKIYRRSDPFIKGKLRIFDCAGPGQQIVVTPEGKLGVCQAFMNTGKFFYNINELSAKNINHVWKPFKKRSPFFIEDCMNCPSLGICGGGCYYSAYQESGDIMGLDKTHCAFVGKTLRFLLKELYKSTAEDF